MTCRAHNRIGIEPIYAEEDEGCGFFFPLTRRAVRLRKWVSCGKINSRGSDRYFRAIINSSVSYSVAPRGTRLYQLLNAHSSTSIWPLNRELAATARRRVNASPGPIKYDF